MFIHIIIIIIIYVIKLFAYIYIYTNICKALNLYDILVDIFDGAVVSVFDSSPTNRKIKTNELSLTDES